MKLTFSIVARNDGYGEGFIPRLQTVLNNIFWFSKEYRLDAEIIIVEWNPPPDRDSLESVLDWRYATLPVRIITIPASLHDGLPGCDKIPLFFGYGHNVAIRRATGDFVLVMTADILYSPEMVSRLSRELLDENCFYGAIRHDLEGHEVVNIRDGEPYLGLHMNACGDFTLMSRLKWVKIAGYPEVPFNTYIDGTVLWLAKEAGMRQIVLKEPIYHLNHEYGSHGRPVLDLNKFPLPGNEHADWGFRDLRLKETRIEVLDV